MEIRGVTRQEILAAIRRADDTHNLTFNRFDAKGKHYLITLRVKDSKGRFHRRGFTGRRLVSACWHAHYRFMEELYKLVPDAIIISHVARYDNVEEFEALVDGTGTKNIGSMMQPLMFEDACDCYVT